MPTGGAPVPAASSVAGASSAAALGAVEGATPSTFGQAVVLLIDPQGDALEIDPAGDPLLVRAGVAWIGKTASETI